MTEADFRRSVRATHPILLDLKLLRAGFHFRDPSEEFRRAALGGDPYVQVYRVGLEHRDYTFLLQDLSYFQLQRLDVGGGHALRYCFMPNPFVFHSFEWFLEEFEVDGADPLAMELYHQYLSEQVAEHETPPLRYEVDYGAYHPLRHPCSHLHVGHNTEARWPVERELTPRAFVLFVVKWFFASAWHAAADEHADSMYFDAALQSARTASARLEDHHFSNDERSQPHLA